MERDAGDIIDRYSIAILKNERIGGKFAEAEYIAMRSGFEELQKRHKNVLWDEFLNVMLIVNGCVWELESELRQGALDGDLTETGRRAILIRKFNSVRVSLKNLINLIVGEGVKDVKHDHLSQSGRDTAAGDRTVSNT